MSSAAAAVFCVRRSMRCLGLALLLVACSGTARRSGGTTTAPHTQLPPEPAAIALQAQINASIASSAEQHTVAPAEYYFNSASLVVSRAHSFTLDGTGSALWFSVGAGLLLHRCVGTTIVGFAIDYDPPAFFQATALADSSQSGKLTSVHMKADTGFLSPHVFQRTYGHSSTGAGTDIANEFIQGPQWWRHDQKNSDSQQAWALTSQGFENFNATSMASPLAPDGSFVFTQPAPASPL